jgi:hypothetical protein
MDRIKVVVPERSFHTEEKPIHSTFHENIDVTPVPYTDSHVNFKPSVEVHPPTAYH